VPPDQLDRRRLSSCSRSDGVAPAQLEVYRDQAMAEDGRRTLEMFVAASLETLTRSSMLAPRRMIEALVGTLVHTSRESLST
jgi:hypothetical protein